MSSQNPRNGLYLLRFDALAPESWVLAEPRDRDGNSLNPWRFTMGAPAKGVRSPVRVSIHHPGSVPDISFGAFNLVVHKHVAMILADVAPGDVELVPVIVEGYDAEELKHYECSDDGRLH